MGSASTGVKAGLASGALMGVVSGAVGYVNMALMKEELLKYFEQLIEEMAENYGEAIKGVLTPETMYTTALISASIGALIMMVVLGAVFGAILGWKWERFPGRGVVKGLLVGVLMFIVLEAVSLAFMALSPLPLSSVPGFTSTRLGLSALISLIIYLLWGAVAAKLYTRWTSKQGTVGSATLRP